MVTDFPLRMYFKFWEILFSNFQLYIVSIQGFINKKEFIGFSKWKVHVPKYVYGHQAL